MGLEGMMVDAFNFSIIITSPALNTAACSKFADYSTQTMTMYQFPSETKDASSAWAGLHVAGCLSSVQ